MKFTLLIIDDEKNIREGLGANFEMEGSAIAGIARHLGHEAGTVCCVIVNRYLKTSNADYKPFVEKLVKLVLNKLYE